MRPRFPFGAATELKEVNTRLRRLESPPADVTSPRLGRLFLVAFIFFIAYCLTTPRQRPEPIDARPNNPNGVVQATPTPAPSPTIVAAPRAELVRDPTVPTVPRAQLVSLGTPHIQDTPVQLGESTWVHMPDGRWVVATFVGVGKSQSDLPLTGNRIGDARYVGEHCWVWLRPIGQTNPTWIDP